MRAALIGGVAVVFALAACGGGGGRLSKSQFAAKANAVCRTYTTKINAVPSPKSINDVPAYVGDVRPFIERGVDELASLKPPADLQSTYDRWVRAQRDALAQTDDLRRAAERNDLAAVNRAIKELNDRARQGNELAGQLGATVCASG